jgi:hypothetical protein
MADARTDEPRVFSRCKAGVRSVRDDPRRPSSGERRIMSKAPAPGAIGKPFRDMTPGQKIVFIGKAFVFFLFGGFVFPTLWID